MHVFRRPLALILATLALGCGGSAATDAGQASDLSGVWTLVSVGGIPLPYDIPSTAGRSPGDKYQVYHGRLEFTPGLLNYGLRDSTRYTSVGGFASVNVNGDDGIVTRNGSVLTLKSRSTPATITVTVFGSSLHAKREAVDYVYQR